MSELFLKNEKVLTIRDVNGAPAEIQKIDNPELLPVCLKKNCTFEELRKWLDRRCMPKQREGLKETVAMFSNRWLVQKNYASLSDQYWLKMRTETWKRVNFFTNHYSEEIGDMFFSPWAVTTRKHDNFSPDLTTNGILKKRWRQNQDGTSRLIKAASKQTHQEPLSEVLTTILAEKLNIIPFVRYDLYVEGTTMCSICDNFVTPDLNFVPSTDIYFTEDLKNGETALAHLIRMCELFDVPGAEEFLKGMVFIDHMTGNGDRNLGNIGFLQDVKTMKFVGCAPLFDCGNAYWNSQDVCGAIKSKFFGEDEMGIVSDVKRKADFNKLFASSGYKHLINYYPCIKDEKKKNLIEAIEKRNHRLELGLQGITR